MIEKSSYLDFLNFIECAENPAPKLESQISFSSPPDFKYSSKATITDGLLRLP